MWLYSLILLCTIIVPVAMSFDKKLRFHKQWKYLFPAIILVSCIFISFDVYFTKTGVWGFNPAYHLNIVYLGLPIEEWLFFIVIPYAGIFLHDSIVLCFPKIRLPNKAAFYLGLIITIALVVLAVLHHKKTYSFYVFVAGFVTIVFSFFDKSKLINRFYITFFIILVPFIAANAILTGSFIENEVVWYNNNENLGIRILTIPIEDFIYGFSLILLVLLLRERISNIKKAKHNGTLPPGNKIHR